MAFMNNLFSRYYRPQQPGIIPQQPGMMQPAQPGPGMNQGMMRPGMQRPVFNGNMPQQQNMLLRPQARQSMNPMMGRSNYGNMMGLFR